MMIAVYISLVILYLVVGLGTAKTFADTETNGITFWQGLLITTCWPVIWMMGMLAAILT